MITNLKVSGMHCHSCEQMIKESLLELDGVLEVSADHAGGSVKVTHKAGKDMQRRIKSTIESMGYGVA
jgi:copper chaperone CopZ